MRIRMYGASDIGRVRKANQDSYYCNDQLGIAIVADGIGGRKGGEIASALAVEGMKKSFVECETLRHEEVTPFLTTSVDAINQGIINYGLNSPEVKGLGTTMNCLLFVGETIYVAHIGDSRTYLYSRNHLWQLTLDHNIEVYMKRGWLQPESVDGSTKPGALVRALGLSTQCEVDVYEKQLQPGELFITCSDGLSGMVTDAKILSIVHENRNRAEVIPKLLISEANRNGGKDNITVVVSEVLKD